MILQTFELTGNEPTHQQLLDRVNGGEFDDTLAQRAFLMLTADCGMVRVNKDKTITSNILIDASNVATFADLEDMIKAHEAQYHATSAE